MTHHPLPRLLLVEDDPVSQAFLTAALHALPADVDSADTLTSALALGQGREYALWLIDAHLGDGSGIHLLRQLRITRPVTPALAHTAAPDLETVDALLAAGFVDVLVKPLPAAEVQGAVQRALGLARVDDLCLVATSEMGHPLWDEEAAALALNGSRAHIGTLRSLFLGELLRQRGCIDAAVRSENFDELRGTLHKLRASCGFVGATRLGEAARALQQRPGSRALYQRFSAVIADTLAAAPAAGSDQPEASPP